MRSLRHTIVFLLCGLALAAGLLLCSCTPSVHPGDSALEAAQVVRVVDGDTLVVSRADGQKERVRLVGIDCEESVAPIESGKTNTAAGVQASDHTKELVHAGQTVWLQKDVSDTDKYDRLLRYVWLEQPADVTSPDEVKAKMLNAILILDGTAKAKRYPPDTGYADLFESLHR